MKSLTEIKATLSAFENKFGLSLASSSQGSDAWFTAKLGVISASNASKAVAGADTDGRLTYMADLVAQIGTGLIEEISSKHLDWGNANEDGARAGYEFTTGQTVTQLPFVFKDETFRIGCSPDGFVSDTKGCEIKCPSNSANYVKFLTEKKLKPEYDWQIQFQMWVTGAKSWDVVQFDPRMLSKPLHFLEVKRDEKKIEKFETLIPAFIKDMDVMLETAGLRFGDQWKRLAPAKQEK